MGWPDASGVKAESIPLHRSDETREGWVVQIWPGSHQGALRNNVEAGVLEPVLAKVKIIQVSS